MRLGTGEREGDRSSCPEARRIDAAIARRRAIQAQSIVPLPEIEQEIEQLEKQAEALTLERP